MLMNLILLSLLRISSAHARMGDGGELGPQGPRCDLNQVNACAESERVAGLNSRSRGESLQPQIDALTPLVQRRKADADQAQSRADLAVSVELVVKDEIAFLAEAAEPAAPEILSGFASAEDFFSLTAAEKSWQERYPADRAQALNAQLGETTAKEVECRNQLQENSTQYATLNGQYESLRSQQANLFVEANAHASMSNTGCNQRMCGR